MSSMVLREGWSDVMEGPRDASDVEAQAATRHEEVLTTLGHAIVSGELAEGDVITLDAIGAKYDVSRSVVREAVRVLESMGMASSRRRVGITVEPRSRWRVFDTRLIRWRLEAGDTAEQLISLLELRRGFEPVAAGMAAERADVVQVRALAQAVSDMTIYGREGDLELYLEADRLFHRTLLAASGNEMLRALAQVVEEALIGRTRGGHMPDRPEHAAIALHDDVARAIRDRDPRAAAEAMRGIIDEAVGAIALT